MFALILVFASLGLQKIGDGIKGTFYKFVNDISVAHSYRNDFEPSSPDINSFKHEVWRDTSSNTINAIETVNSPFSSNSPGGVGIRRVFFDNPVVSSILGLVLPIFSIPPIAVLPLAALAYYLLFREEIGEIVETIFCKEIFK